MAGESDTALRLRTQQRIIGFANAGGAAHYRYWALSASSEVVDVAVDSPAPGVVRISVLPAGDATEVPESLLDVVHQTVLQDDVRVLTDTVEVVPMTLIPTAISAHIWLYPDMPMAVFDALEERLRIALRENASLGWDLTHSWLIGQLQQPGVHKVELISPSTDLPAASTEAVRVVTAIELELAGRKR